MFVHETALPMLLAPRDYVDDSTFEAEKQRIVANAWRYVCLARQQANPGDQFALQIDGTRGS